MQYDAVVIGSGVGGLICANYLIDAGMKVLLLEQHYRYGGCCSYFTRRGFTFDVGVHYLGGLSEGGFTAKIFSELNLWDSLAIRRLEISDMLIFPEHKIRIWTNFEKTKDEICSVFPEESQSVVALMNLLSNRDTFKLYKCFKDKTFKQVLDEHTSNQKLQAVFISLLGNIGLPAKDLSALTSAILFRDYIFDGGYVPEGGTYRFTHALLHRFKRRGGEVIMRAKVDKIIVRGGRVRAVRLENGNVYESRIVASNADVRATFCDLIGEDGVPSKYFQYVKSLTPAVSAFIVYLALISRENLKLESPNIWYCKSYDMEAVYEETFRSHKTNLDDFVFCSFGGPHTSQQAPIGCESGHLLVLSSAKDSDVNSHRQMMEQRLIALAEEIRPKLAQDILFYESATPMTLERYTGNRGGSIYGLASTAIQVSRQLVQEKTDIDGLYLCGHWVSKQTGQGGVTMAAQSGRSVAKKIINSSSRVGVISN
jgi:phytoene dehydrogenase-like protein